MRSLLRALLLAWGSLGVATGGASGSPSAAVLDPPHPDPLALSCGLQLWCTPSSPCLPNQDQYALVTFDLSGLYLNYTMDSNLTDYSTYDANSDTTYFSNVCGPTKRSCPAPHTATNNWGLAMETTNPVFCFPTGHVEAAPGYNLVQPLDATQGLQVRYVDGEWDQCTGGAANPRQVNYVFYCNQDSFPLNPFVSASMWTGNSCNYTFYFSSEAAVIATHTHTATRCAGRTARTLIFSACLCFVSFACVFFVSVRSSSTLATPHLLPRQVV